MFAADCRFAAGADVGACKANRYYRPGPVIQGDLTFRSKPDMYEDLLPLTAPEQLVGALKPIDVRELRRTHADLPDDYVSFLSRIGAGAIGQFQYSLYTGLAGPDFVYGDVPPQLADVLLFGDDFQGFNAGFCTKTWEVVEIDPLDRSVHVVAPSFEIFIRETIKNLL